MKNYTQNQKSYYEKLKDPRWQKRRLEILERDNFQCCFCIPDPDEHNELHVHHWWYEGENPWDAPDEALITLCKEHHEEETGRRGEVEQKLLRQLRAKRFDATAIDCIAWALNEQEKVDVPECLAKIVFAIDGAK